MSGIIHLIAKPFSGPAGRRAGAALLLGLALAAAFAQMPLYARLQWWLGDAQQRLLAEPLPFEHVVAFDVDEESMQRLGGELGAWPYPRETYANAARYLAAKGARVIAYDILFSEARSGDPQLARALDNRSVLAAAALPLGLRRGDEYAR